MVCAKPGRPGKEAQPNASRSSSTNGVATYGDSRDRPDREATSRLSPHLVHGEITPRQIWHALEGADTPTRDAEKFRSELGWREFCWHLLFHFPDLATKNYDSSFDAFHWGGSAQRSEAWQRGQTGYPVVDAAMRQLWQTGWMHNRMRMVAASFLSKHLLTHWRQGEQWFWDTLVDADAASNPANWQWVAGSGADAAPYFRIFNPILQGEKFDPDGDYVRRYVPEIASLPDKVIHKPWQASRAALEEAGIELGKTYPQPIVDHGQARDKALAAYKATRGD